MSDIKIEVTLQLGTLKKGCPKLYGYYPGTTLPGTFFKKQICGEGSRTKLANILVMQKLGWSLSKLVKLCNGKFTTETVGRIGIALINHVEHLHRHG